jgi:hypothetical protein
MANRPKAVAIAIRARPDARVTVSFFLLILLVAIAATRAVGHEYANAGVTVSHPWARATPAGATVAAAYFEIRSEASAADRLVAAASDAAERVEVHTHIEEDGVMKMRRIDALPVAAGQSTVLKPSGHHLMLFGLKRPLKEGDMLKLSLTFETAGTIEVDATVEPIGAKGPHGLDHQPGHGADHSDHHSGHH